MFIRQLQILDSTVGNLDELQPWTHFCAQHGARALIERTYAPVDVHTEQDPLASGQQFGKLAVRLQRLSAGRCWGLQLLRNSTRIRR